MTDRKLKTVSVAALLGAVILLGSAADRVFAADRTLKAPTGKTMVKPSWPTACTLALKHCRVIRTCRTEHVADCTPAGKCKLLYRIKRVCRCRLMCRWHGKPNCVIHTECPDDGYG